MAEEEGITVKKSEDSGEWYNQVVLKGGLADFSDVKGCMIIKPDGYAIWEAIRDYFDTVIKAHGVRNAYFPLLIPEKFFHLEAEHAEGFTPEVAWVTHAGDKELEEKYAIRPTSETTICDVYSKWLRSYRDLPLLINQWANVLRWETKATRPFLRSREFLWQEGHCLYETNEACEKDTLFYLETYAQLCKELLAVPVLTGRKTEAEKFAGAEHTYTIEAFMPDGKALQMGTSHHLGQGFMKVFKVQYLGKDEKMHYPFYNSWGISTRLIGGLVMMHSDDKGLVLPPAVAYHKVVIVPILFKDSKDSVLKACRKLAKDLAAFNPILDDNEEHTSGWKFNQYELRGIPLRIEVGPKDIQKKAAMVVRRDTGAKESIAVKDLKKKIPALLEKMHDDLYAKAEKHLKESIVSVKDFKAFEKAITNKKIVLAPFCLQKGCEVQIKEKTTATSRCIPFDSKVNGKCVHCGKAAQATVYFSKSY